MGATLRGPGLGAKIALYEQLRSMHAAGFDWEHALDLVEQRTSGGAKEAASALRAAVEHGSSLASGMRARPQLFSRFEVALVDAGERSGRTEELLSALVAELERRRSVRRRVLAAAAYPVFLLHFAILLPIGVMAAVSGIGYLIVVVPSLLLVWALLLGGVVATRLVAESRGMARLRLGLPFLGGIARLRAISAFCAAFSALHGAGLGHVEAVETAAAACGNAELGARLGSAAGELRGGASLTQALLSVPTALPEELHRMTATAEDSGDLEHSFQRLAALFAERADARLGPFLKLLPALFLLPIGLLILLLGLNAVSSYFEHLTSL